MKSISEKIKETVRPLFMRNAEEKTQWILKIREIKASDEYQAIKGSVERFEHLTSLGYGKKHISLAQYHSSDIAEKMQKEAESTISKIDLAVAKKLAGVDIKAVELNHCCVGKDGFIEGDWTLTTTDNKTRFFQFYTMYAGGYNIQCLHVRTKYILTK